MTQEKYTAYKSKLETEFGELDTFAFRMTMLTILRN